MFPFQSSKLPSIFACNELKQWDILIWLSGEILGGHNGWRLGNVWRFWYEKVMHHHDLWVLAVWLWWADKSVPIQFHSWYFCFLTCCTAHSFLLLLSFLCPLWLSVVSKVPIHLDFFPVSGCVLKRCWLHEVCSLLQLLLLIFSQSSSSLSSHPGTNSSSEMVGFSTPPSYPHSDSSSVSSRTTRLCCGGPGMPKCPISDPFLSSWLLDGDLKQDFFVLAAQALEAVAMRCRGIFLAIAPRRWGGQLSSLCT